MNFTVKRITKKFIFSGMRSAEMLLIRAESYYHMGEQGLALDDINTLRSNRIKDYVPLTMDQLPEPVEGTYGGCYWSVSYSIDVSYLDRKEKRTFYGRRSLF